MADGTTVGADASVAVVWEVMQGMMRPRCLLSKPGIGASVVTQCSIPPGGATPQGPRQAHCPCLRRMFHWAMAVYVDKAIFPWRGRRWAHLMADDLDELHAFAARLGIPRYKFQDKRSGAHYDIDDALRTVALQLGAVPVSRSEDRVRMRAIIANARKQWSGHADATSDATAGVDAASD